MIQIKFKCVYCGSTRGVEETQENVTESFDVRAISDEGKDGLAYGDMSSDGGFTGGYFCSKCGNPLEDEEGGIITDPEALFEFLKANNFLVEGS